MLDGGLDGTYRDALPFAHEPYVQVDVLDGFGNVLENDIEFSTGAVDATLTSRVSRTFRITLDEDFYPYDASDLLAPYGNMIRAYRGVRFADNRVIKFPVFLGRIQNTSFLDPGQTQVVAYDFAQEILDAKFFSPRNSHVGVDVSDEIKELITDAWPSAMFGEFDAPSVPVRAMTWQLERGQALDELATSASSFWYPLADGKFVLRRYPWTVEKQPVVEYSDSGNNSTITFSYPHRNRNGVFNSLTVTGERLNGDEAVYATAQDLDESSLTYVGSFGLRHQLLRLQTPGSQSAVRDAAESNLHKSISLVDAWTWNMIPDPALELGDTVRLLTKGRNILQVVESMSVPLDLTAPMVVHGRSAVIGSIGGAE